MPDPALQFDLATLAQRFELELHGNGATRIHGVAPLDRAQSGQLSFLSNSRYSGQLAGTQAGAVIVTAEHVDECPVPALVANDPYLAYARIAALFQKQLAVAPGVHASSVIDPAATVSPTSSIGPLCVVAAGARIEDGAVLGPHCVIGPDCVVGAGSRLVAHVTLVADVRLGQRVLVHPGAVLGADGFGLAVNGDHWIKVPQLGGVQIGDDCEIGANTTIDRGALNDTVLEEDVHLDNQIQIAHNVHIGAHTAMAGCSAVAGSARIGRWCMVGGNAGILGHLEVADHVVITAKSLVTRSIREPGEYSSGTPLQDNASWRKNAARFKHLDEMSRRLRALERNKHD